jgi:sarcosine oxidase, subunit beta
MTTCAVDVAVVGGGLVGSWTAFFLARRGVRVALLEKGTVGAQSSGVNFGNLRLQGRHPSQYPLSLRSHAIWEQIEQLIGDACEFSATGHLYLAFDAAEAAKLEHYAHAAESHALQIEHFDRDAACRRWPWLAPVIQAATHSARDATANPRLVTPAVARAAKRLGTIVIENCRVLGIDGRDNRFSLTTDTGLAVTARHVVNAAGAWAVDIARGFGESAPIFPAGPPQFVTEPLPYRIVPSVQTIDGSVICRQIPRGNVIVAGYPRTASDPVGNRAPVPAAKTLNTMAHLRRLVPSLAAASVIRVWSGIEGYLPDMLPVIGPSATTQGLFHAFGFCGHGFQIGPGVGAVLSDLIIDGCTETPIDAFSIARFERPVVADEKWAREFDATATSASSAA